MKTLFEYLDTKIKNGKFLNGSDPDNPKTWKVGDIIWGAYGEFSSPRHAIPRFYKIVGVYPKSFTMVRLVTTTTSGKRIVSPEWDEIPTEETYIDPPIRAKKQDDGTVTTNQGDYGKQLMHLYLWDGNPVHGYN